MKYDSRLIAEKAELGINGIRNLGNTCYVNAALNCLFKIQPLADYCLNNLHLKELKPQAGDSPKEYLTISFASLVKYTKPY